MAKKKTHIQRSGSWTICILLLIIFFPLGILYWLFKIKKTKVYKYDN